MAPYKPQRCSVDCPNTLQNVLKVLDLILLNFCESGKKKSKPFQDVFTYSAVRQQQEIPDSRRAKSVNKSCVKFMNQSLCCHRYRTAIKVLWILCQDTTVIGSYVFKAALLAFDNLSFPHKEELIGNLMRVLQKLGYLQRKEVSLEYVIFGIHNHVPDLPKKAKEIGLGNVKRTYRNKHVLDPMFEAYCSVLQYPEFTENIDDTQLSQAKLTAESTILQLKNIVTNPGDFDIFVLKLIKMLDLCDRGEEIEEVLQKYVENNPNNLNARIYLCVYLCNFSSDTEKIISNLEMLAKLCPSDERILLLLEHWSQSAKKLKDCLKLNFMFLDYPSNGENLLGWQLLSNFLNQVKLRNCDDELKKTQSLWKSRHKCWNWLYFNPSKVPYLNECEYHLTEVKAKVIWYFDKEHKYIKEALNKFPSLELSS